MSLQVIGASRLRDGVAVWLDGRQDWSTDFSRARVFGADEVGAVQSLRLLRCAAAFLETAAAERRLVVHGVDKGHKNHSIRIAATAEFLNTISSLRTFLTRPATVAC